MPGAGNDDTPDTIPVVLTEPIAVLLLLHTPPAGALFNVVVLPSHTLVVPVMTDGSGLTVTIMKFLQPVTGAV